MKADTICCYCVFKCMTRGIAESLHAYTNRARLTACEVGVYFSSKILQLSKICPPPSLRSSLHSSPMGIFLKDYSMYYFSVLTGLQLLHCV